MTKLRHTRFVTLLALFLLISYGQPSALAGGVNLPTIPVSSRLIVVLFTGFTVGPGEPSGMSDLLYEIQTDPALSGAIGKVFTYDDPPSPILELPHQTALNWVLEQQPTAADKIVLIGHSYGANRARLFGGDLLLRGLRAQALITIDAIEWYLCNPQTVSAFGCLLCNQSNYFYPTVGIIPIKKSYVQVEDSCIRGYKITPFVTVVAGEIHTTIDNSPLVHQEIRQLLDSLY